MNSLSHHPPLQGRKLLKPIVLMSPWSVRWGGQEVRTPWSASPQLVPYCENDDGFL